MDVARAVHRNTLLLAIAQGFLYSTLPFLLAVGSVAVVDLSGRKAAVGVLAASYFASAAVGALIIGRWMDRVGRKPGLAVGYIAIAVGALASAAAVERRSALLLVLAAVPFGLGAGAALLGRGAVADMHPPDRRGRAVGLVLAASVIGAVGSAPLVAWLQHVSEDRLGLRPFVGPWLVVPLLAAGGLVCVLLLRPDPRDLAVRDRSADAAPAAPSRNPRELLALPPFGAAVVAAGIGQAAMIAVMGVAPIVVHHHGDLAVSGVLSVHFVGMFAFMPLIGVIIDRIGRRRGLVAAVALSATGVLVGALSTQPVVFGFGLFLVGLGWAVSYLGATAIVSDVTDPLERSGALGFTDLLVSLSSAVGGLVGGALLEAGGYPALAVGVAMALVPVLAVVLPLREEAPGRWALPEPAEA
jgi:MFS family permease